MKPLFFSLLLCVSCNYTDFADYACPPGGTTLTYDNFGRGFMETQCKSGHGGGADRKGAPIGYDFGSLDAVRKFKVRIFDRAAASNSTMPVGPDGPPASERAKLADWLACGAP